MTTEILNDDGHTRADLKLLEMAIRKGWEIPDELLRHLPKVAGAIALKGKPRDQIAAMKVLIAMKGQNDERELPKQIEHHHTHDIGPVTEDNIEAQRAIRFARLARSM